VEGELVAESIDVGGKVEAHEITAKNEVSVGGSIITDAGVKASYVGIGRHGRVVGPIRADEILIGRRASVEDVYGGKIVMEGNARARNLYGERIYIESGCRVDGEVQYIANLEAENGVSFAKKPVKVASLPKAPTTSPPAAAPPQARTPPAEKKYCQYCGTENRSDALFCKKCGTRLAEE